MMSPRIAARFTEGERAALAVNAKEIKLRRGELPPGLGLAGARSRTRYAGRSGTGCWRLRSGNRRRTGMVLIASRSFRRSGQLGWSSPGAENDGQSRMQQLGVSRERDRLGLYSGVHRDPFDVAGAQCAGRVRHAQALSQEELELVAEPLSPMAQVRALVRECVLEKLLAGEVLEVGVIDPAGLSQRTRRAAVRCVRVRTNASLSLDIFTLPF